MARKNRRKLHLALRLAAEARKAEAVALRRVRAQHAAASASTPAAHRTRVASLPGSHPLHPDTARRLQDALAARGEPKEVRRRIKRLFAATARTLPEVCTEAALPFLLLLARSAWVRPLEAWTPPGGSWRRRRAHLVRHLVCRHDVPAFLVDAIEPVSVWWGALAVEDTWTWALLGHVASGASLRGAPAHVLPAPLTRRMAHLLLSARAGTPPVLALRRAQVVGWGGDVALADALVACTRLGNLMGDRGADEPWWHEVVGWLVTRPVASRDDLALLVDWLEVAREEAAEEGRTFSVRGRPLDAVLARARAWLACTRPTADTDLPGCGLPSTTWTQPDGTWTFDELRDTRALWDEGSAQGNCVFGYARHVRQGRVAIWSARRDGVRRATVEIRLSDRTVVQARARFNADVPPDTAAAIRAWASRCGLGLGANVLPAGGA